MESNINSGVTGHAAVVRLLYILCITGIGIFGFTREWTADNLLMNVMISAVWCMMGSFMALGWMKALYFLGFSVVVLIGLKGLVGLLGIFAEGRLNEGAIFASLFPLGCAVMLAIVLRLQMLREVKSQPSSDQGSSSPSGPQKPWDL